MDILCSLLNVYVLVLFARMLTSWFPVQPGTFLASLSTLVYDLTEPVLRPVRGMLPPTQIGGVGIDFSLTIVLFGVVLMQRGICA